MPRRTRTLDLDAIADSQVAYNVPAEHRICLKDVGFDKEVCDFLTDFASVNGCSVGTLLAIELGLAAAVNGTRVTFENLGLTHYGNLMLLLVAPRGFNKSSPFRILQSMLDQLKVEMECDDHDIRIPCTSVRLMMDRLTEARNSALLVSDEASAILPAILNDPDTSQLFRNMWDDVNYEGNGNLRHDFVLRDTAVSVVFATQEFAFQGVMDAEVSKQNGGLDRILVLHGGLDLPDQIVSSGCGGRLPAINNSHAGGWYHHGRHISESRTRVVLTAESQNVVMDEYRSRQSEQNTTFMRSLDNKRANRDYSVVLKRLTANYKWKTLTDRVALNLFTINTAVLKAVSIKKLLVDADPQSDESVQSGDNGTHTSEMPVKFWQGALKLLDASEYQKFAFMMAKDSEKDLSGSDDEAAGFLEQAGAVARLHGKYYTIGNFSRGTGAVCRLRGLVGKRGTREKLKALLDKIANSAWPLGKFATPPAKSPYKTEEIWCRITPRAITDNTLQKFGMNRDEYTTNFNSEREISHSDIASSARVEELNQFSLRQWDV